MTPATYPYEAEKATVKLSSELFEVENCPRCSADTWDTAYGACLWHRHVAKLLAAGYLSTTTGD